MQWLWDHEGRRYLDFLAESSPLASDTAIRQYQRLGCFCVYCYGPVTLVLGIHTNECVYNKHPAQGGHLSRDRTISSGWHDP